MCGIQDVVGKIKSDSHEFSFAVIIAYLKAIVKWISSTLKMQYLLKR